MDRTQGYWAKYTTSRLSRRRLMATGGALATGALALGLVGCGNDDGGTQDASGLISKPVDTTSKAKAGGILQISWTFTWKKHLAYF